MQTSATPTITIVIVLLVGILLVCKLLRKMILAITVTGILIFGLFAELRNCDAKIDNIDDDGDNDE